MNNIDLKDQIELERERLSFLWKREKKISSEMVGISARVDLLILQYYRM